jgi:hypothetical protein
MGILLVVTEAFVAGLPTVFALAMRSLAAGRAVTADGTQFAGPPTTAGRMGAIILFAVCVAAVLFGIVVIVFGKQIFEK